MNNENLNNFDHNQLHDDLASDNIFHDKPTEIGVTVAIAAAVGDLPEHFNRSRELRLNRSAKQRLALSLMNGMKVQPSMIESAFVKNDASGTICSEVKLVGGWRAKRYNVALVVNIIEYSGTQAVSKTTRTIMGWCSDEPHPTFGFTDDAVININRVVTRDMVENGSAYGTIRNSSTLTGTASDEFLTEDKKVLIGSNIATKIQFGSEYYNGTGGSGGFTSNLIHEEYGTDTKVTSINASASQILTDSINNSVFDSGDAPIGFNDNGEVDEFVLLLNSFTVNQTGTQVGLKSFTWGSFKAATKWSKFNKLTVFDTPNAPIFDPNHKVGSTESIEHNTNDAYINDIGFPMVHSICSVIDKYCLVLINASFNWIEGSTPLCYTNIVRPLDNSELAPAIVNNIEIELARAFSMFTTIVGVYSIEMIFDGGFGKSSGISLRVNGSPTAIPLVVSPALTSLFNESVVSRGDDRVAKTTALAISNIMKEHGTVPGGYQENVPMERPVMVAGHGHTVPVHQQVHQQAHQEAQQNTAKPRRAFGRSSRSW